MYRWKDKERETERETTRIRLMLSIPAATCHTHVAKSYVCTIDLNPTGPVPTQPGSH